MELTRNKLHSVSDEPFRRVRRSVDDARILRAENIYIDWASIVDESITCEWTILTNIGISPV